MQETVIWISEALMKVSNKSGNELDTYSFYSRQFQN